MISMNNLTRLLIGLATGTVMGTLTVAVRRWQREELGLDGRSVPHARPEEEEPILGYDGMDAGTLIDWLERAGLDSERLRRVRSYEVRNRNRGDVLAVIDDLTG